MPNNNDPPKPPPDPAKGTGTGKTPIPAKPPKGGPTPDGNYEPPQKNRKVIAGAIGGAIGALVGVGLCAD